MTTETRPSMRLSESLAAFAAAHANGGVPADVVERLRLHATDAVGIGIAASVDPISAPLAIYLEGRPPGTVPTLLGVTTNEDDAALVDASLMHALDFDDTDEASLTHPSAPIVATALAVGTSQDATGDAVVNAIAIGAEATIAIGRTACADFHSRLHTAGFHPTAVCGAIGAALTAGVLLDLDEDGLVQAVAIAESLAGGSSQVISRGLRTKMLNTGRAASTGIFAARAARAGFPGGVGLLEEPRGFFDRLARMPEISAAPITGLGEEWRTPEVSLKTFPAGFGEHPFIFMAMELRERLGGAVERIGDVVYGDLEAQIANASEPAAEKRRPASGYHGKFSRYYCIACGLVRRSVGLDEFTDDTAHDPLVLDVAARTSYRVDTTRWLEVQDRADGTVLHAEWDGSVGSLDEAGALMKFRDNCTRATVSPVQVSAAIGRLFEGDRAAAVTSSIAAARRADAE